MDKRLGLRKSFQLDLCESYFNTFVINYFSKSNRMKNLIVLLVVVNLMSFAMAQTFKPIELLAPDKTRGLPLMEALSVKASVREYSEKSLTLQDLSDLIWAANGINRPFEGKRTASSAMNAQDIDIYVLMQDGVYLYNAASYVLDTVVSGDYCDLVGKTDAPVTLVLISDISRFRFGSDEQRLTWANIDAGIVSQNISLFCAATGLKTCPKASFPGMDKIREVLNLTDSQHVILNHPVGYKKE
jgi:hypothetical protein